LWLFRLRAIYGGDRIVTFIFGSLWLAFLGASVTLPIGGVTTTSLENPPGCLIVRAKKYDAAFGIILTMYDTLVFLAISSRLVSNFTQAEQLTPWGLIKALFSGSNLPAFSKTLFTDGQIYYMCVSVHPFSRRQHQLSGRITVIFNLLATLLGLIPQLSPVYKGLFTIPSITLTSILTCRVYRRTRFGVMRFHSDLTLPTVYPLGPGGILAIPLSVVQFCTESSGAADSGDGSDSTGDTSATLSTPSKANTLSFLSGILHDSSTDSAP
jgi:hypothetical protein